MPVLRFSPGRVEEALGLPLREALEWMERLKIEAELTPEGYVELEIEVDRPDMYSLEGIARQLAGLLGRARGLPRYEIVDSGFRVVAEEVPTRPYIAAAVVWDVNVDEEFLRELIQFQEKLHGSIGGDRIRVAIGLHDLDKVPSKTLYYRFEQVEKVRFTPLGGGEPRSLSEILAETEQGRKYGSVSLRSGRHPVLYSGEHVISAPPVINAELTRVEPGTRSLLIDVTGTQLEPVLDVLSIIASSLAERAPGRRIGLVEVEAPWGKLREPQMKPRDYRLDVAYASRLLGTPLSPGEAAEHLERMRFDASPENGLVYVKAPRYRVDILHEADLAEEILLSIGIDNLEPAPLATMMRGRLVYTRYWEREARKLLVGHGYVELVTYSLVPCSHAEEVELPPEALVRLENPVGVESACLRASLLPGLLEAAARNQHLLPLRVFEVGEAYVVTGRGEAGVDRRLRLALLYMDNKAGYEDIQAVVYSVVRRLGDEIAMVEPLVNRFFIKGRAARMRTRMGVTAVLGEVNPELLERHGIEYPVAAAEIDYTGLDERNVPRP